jgi:hypothetical protein
MYCHYSDIIIHTTLLVFDTIPILAVGPVPVSCQHSVVGILVGIFYLADDLAGTPFLNKLVGTPVFLKKGARMH